MRDAAAVCQTARKAFANALGSVVGVFERSCK